MNKNWNILYKENEKEKSIIEKLLEVRKINSEQKKNDFLNPLKMKITSPYAFSDMKKSVDRIKEAILKNEKILIYGDFDADGITSTIILYKTLQKIGANVEYYIPNRLKENHGLNKTTIMKLVAKKAKLFITVDCGISNNNEIEILKTFKIDTIITDHHECGKEKPNAFAILNPKVEDSLIDTLTIEEIEYLTYLAGVGVAFKLACALLEKYNLEDYVNELIPILTIGTIADLVPLIGENRCFVSMGLKLLNNGAKKSITKLLESINYQSEITSESIAYYIAPRINAAGRIKDTKDAFTFLYSDDDEEIEKAIEQLNKFNIQRQEISERMYLEAIEILDNEEAKKHNAIVLYKKDWHSGIIGIVASKLVETFYKPTFIICGEDDILKCSARSVNEINLYEILSQMKDYFEGFGGHYFAGGFSFDKNKISVKEITKTIYELVDEGLCGKELKPSINIDLEIEKDNINFDLVEIIKKLEPFGSENEAPIFCVKGVELCSSRLIGKNCNHLKLQCKTNNNYVDCVFWNQNQLPSPKNNNLDLAFVAKENQFNGEIKLQLDLRGINFEIDEQILIDSVKNKKIQKTFKILDHRNKTDIYNLIDNYIMQNPEKLKIYAKRKDLIDKLSVYPNIAKNICEEFTYTSQIMFFDYPKSLQEMTNILKSSQPDIIHLMNNNIEKTDIKEFIKILSGMFKFIYNNKAGKIDIDVISNFLGVDNSIIDLLIDIFVDINFIKIKQNIISEIKIVEFSKIEEHEKYPVLENKFEDIYEFQRFLNIEDVEKISLLLNKKI